MGERLKFEVGDIVKLKKPHPCGSREWKILRVGALLLALELIQALCSYFMDYQGHSIGAKMERDMRAQLFRHCQKSPVLI